MSTKNKRSFRLTETADNLLDQLAERMGLSKTAVLETLIRNEAKAEGVEYKPTAVTRNATGAGK